jgi:STE24 endopeptidase
LRLALRINFRHTLLLMNFSNPYFTIILLTVVVIHLIEMISTILNLKALQPQVPESFRDIYDEESYRKSQEYTRESSRFELIASTAKLGIFLLFWLCGGYAWLDELVLSWGQSELVTGLLVITLLYLGSQLVSLPFDLFDTFVIEQKHGFNKMTPGLFFADQLKGLLLAGLLGLPLLALLLWIFGKHPLAWLEAWGYTTAFVLLMAYIGPAFIMPLYNKFTPLEDGELKSSVTAMAQRCGFPFQEVSVTDGSKRSTRSNAFFAGFGSKKKIALYDTLIAQQTVPELVAVLAHEIGHYKRKHIIQRLVHSVLQIGLLFFLLGLFMKNEALFAAFGVAKPSVYLSFVFFMSLFQVVQFFLGIFSSWWSRKQEYEADAYASQAVGGPQDLISALRKLAKSNLSNLTPHPFSVFLHYSHPPLLERLKALAALR